jgi:nickel/cobalt transporter (NicO) family protein
MHQLVKTWSARVAAALAALFVVTSLAFAQAEVKKSPFGAGPAPAPAASPTTVAAPVGSSGLRGWMMATQESFRRQAGQALRDLKTDHPKTAAAWVAGFSFLYGLLHAAGPGHGKAVISSYVLANRQTLRRGVFLSFLSAFFQACSAIILVGLLAIVFNATSPTRQAAEAWIETISWGLLALYGVWLLYRQVKPMLVRHAVQNNDHRHAPAELAHAGHVHGPGCSHDHASVKSSPRVAFPAQASSVHIHGPNCSHRQNEAHVHDASCGHAHMPDPSQLEGPWVWSQALSLALTVGMRPCNGAIAMLFLTLSQGMLWAGVFATFMMSLGTAIMVSLLAALAVGSRDLAIRLAGDESPWAERLESFAGIAGAGLVVLLGTTFFLLSLRGPAPF